MGVLTERVMIAAPPEVVYDLVIDPARFEEWQPYLRSVVERAGRNDGIGSSFGAVYRVFGRRMLTHWVITAAERARLLEATGTVSGGWAHWGFALERAPDDRCRLASTLEYDLPGAVFAGPIAALAHVVLARRFRETVRNLGVLAETEVAEARSRAAEGGTAFETGSAQMEGQAAKAQHANEQDAKPWLEPAVAHDPAAAAERQPSGEEGAGSEAPQGVGPRRSAARGAALPAATPAGLGLHGRSSGKSSDTRVASAFGDPLGSPTRTAPALVPESRGSGRSSSPIDP